MLLRHLLKRMIESGTLKVVDARGRTHLFGDGQAPFSTIRLHDPALHYKLFYNPSLYTGEAYMDGTLTIEEGDLYGFLEIVLYNLNRMERLPAQFKSSLMERPLRPLRTFNPIERAKRNAAHHYDLSNALYDLFLDKDRQYSCAYFSSDNESLDVAQDNKKRHIASKLLLGAGQKVLDIGSGWGGLGMFVARMMDGVDVTGITVSEEQLKVSRARAAAAGLADRVRFELRDYRQETGRYDRVVSVGMFEHVGPSHYASYFAKIKELLTNDGVCLLHSIGRMEPPGGTNAWLQKYIVPGGYTPALSEVLTAVEKVGLWVTDIEILRLHYAKTLREWRRRFMANRDEVRKLYDERFCRMWEYYLASCECAFKYLRQMVFQMQLTKHVEAAPLTRDYMVDWEREHATALSLSNGALV
ncbi:MAG TPA: cyclopropane-fatty-acyl-phospholipid synthase family protein [Alphaproteobacteria bacterium]